MDPLDAMLQDAPTTWGARVAPWLVTLLLTLSGVAHLLDVGASAGTSLDPARVERAAVCLAPPGWLSHCGMAVPPSGSAGEIVPALAPAPVDTQS